MKKRKRALTLLEIMIVIALITLISGVISYNMRGTLERGRAFKTEQAKEQLHDMLLLCVAEGKPIDKILSSKNSIKSHLTSLGLAKDIEKLMTDGWGNEFEIKANDQHDDFVIQSNKLNAYRESHK